MILDSYDVPMSTEAIAVCYANFWTRRAKSLDALIRDLGATVTQLDGTSPESALTGPQPDVMLLGFGPGARSSATFIANFKTSPWYGRVPLIALIDSRDQGHLWRCMEWGCDDAILRPRNSALLRARVRQWVLRRRIREKERAKGEAAMHYSRRAAAFAEIIVPLGVSMISESDFDVLLEMILAEARRFCHADGGTIYLVTERDDLEFKIIVNETMKIHYGAKRKNPPPFEPIPLDRESGRSSSHIAAHVALTGETVNVQDVYSETRFDLSGVHAFDAATGYHSRSILTIALRDQSDRVIGVLQLVNARDPDGYGVSPFTALDQAFIEALSRLAGQALDSYRKMAKLRKQANAIVVNIDAEEKSKQVEAITSSSYFVTLKARANALRDAPQRTESSNSI